MKDAIRAEALRKQYAGGVTALDGLYLGVPTGSIFALLGPNGAGKSTAVRILTTLATPDAGRAWVAGIDVLRDPEQVRRTVGYVAQGSGVDGRATARENLRLQGRLHGLAGAALQRSVVELVAWSGLSDVADRPADGYSGGTRRRLDVAMALVHRPRVLFLDEPTTGLDPEVRTAMWEVVSHLATSRGMTVLLTTHYLEDADRLAATVAILDRGRVVATGTPDDLKRRLDGDTLTIELVVPADLEAARAALGGLPGVADVAGDGRTLRARTRDAARTAAAVLPALASRGVTVASVTVARPTLDDVYLRHTGRHLAVPATPGATSASTGAAA